MAESKYKKCMLPVMQLISDGQEHKVKEIVATLSATLPFLQEEQDKPKTTSSKPIAINQITWAIFYLKKDGLLVFPQRGSILITDAGISYIKQKDEEASNAINNTTPKKQLLEYSVIWQPCSKANDLANRFYVPSYTGHLPFFLDGTDLDLFRKKHPVELTELHLLKGILLGLHEFDTLPIISSHPEDKDTLLYLLDALGNGFRCSSPNQMILDIAYRIREANGNLPSSLILKTGHELIPSCSKIMSDLICDFWELAIDKDSSFVSEIPPLFTTIDFDDIIPAAQELIPYYGVAALRILEKYADIQAFMDKFVDPYVKNRKIISKINYLLDYEGAITAKELDIREL